MVCAPLKRTKQGSGSLDGMSSGVGMSMLQWRVGAVAGLDGRAAHVEMATVSKPKAKGGTRWELKLTVISTLPCTGKVKAPRSRPQAAEQGCTWPVRWF